MTTHKPSNILQLELDYDNQRKALFLWLANITPSSQVNEIIKDCTTDDLMHIFDIGYRHACTQIQYLIKRDGSSKFKSAHMQELLDEQIFASFSLGRQGHTDQEKNKLRQKQFQQFAANNPFEI
jgi:hypothetical protein